MAKDDDRKTCWVLLRFHNDYDQRGAYYETSWLNKPTLKELANYFKGTEAGSYFADPMAALAFIMHVESGGGRRNYENEWYELNQVKFGERYNG